MAVAKMTTAELNELLRKVYERRMIRVLFDDPTLPWLPESYWREQFEANVQSTTQDLMQMVEELRERKRMRAWEDQQLERNASVDALLEEGIEPLKGDDPRLTYWGRMEMRHSGGTLRAPTQGDVQPSYDFQCYQCGRPITSDGFDHAHRTRCDAALMPADFEPWPHHCAAPWHGEEEDEGDEE